MILLSLAPHVDERDARALVRRAVVGVGLHGAAGAQVTRHGPHMYLIGEPRPWSSDPRSNVPAVPAMEMSVDGDRATVRIDPLGITHVYSTTADGWAAFGDSSAELAVLGDRSIATDAVATLAMFGHLLGDQSLFVDVTKCPGGHLISLAAGRLDVTPEALAPAEVDRSARPDRAAGPLGAGGRTGAAVLRQVMVDCLDRHPDAALELSGGLDSRIVLAALPPASRQGRLAITLGGPDAPDVRIATELARREGLTHHVLDTAPVVELAPDDLLQRVRDAAITVDFADHAPSQALLQWAEDQLDQRPRFTGMNGEFARGFYSPAQSRGVTSRRRVERLARWRLFTNYSVDSVWFDDAWYDSARRRTIDRLETIFAGLPADWLAALPEYYVQQRVVRWAGPRYSTAARSALAPFVSEHFLHWARSLPPADQRSSREMARVAMVLDDGLAALPLDGGPAPRDLAGSTLPARGRRARLGWSRVFHKVAQRARSTPKLPSVEASLIGRIAEVWRPDVEAVGALGAFDHDALGRLERGDLPLHAPTASFLVNVEGAAHYLSRAAAQLSR